MTDALAGPQQQRIARTDAFFVASGHAERSLDACTAAERPDSSKCFATGASRGHHKGNAMFQTLVNLA